MEEGSDGRDFGLRPVGCLGWGIGVESILGETPAMCNRSFLEVIHRRQHFLASDNR